MKKSEFCEVEIKAADSTLAKKFAIMAAGFELTPIEPKESVANFACTSNTDYYRTNIPNPFANVDGLFRIAFDNAGRVTLSLEAQVGLSTPAKEPMTFSSDVAPREIYDSFVPLINSPSLGL